MVIYTINGKFFTQNITGVQRHAREMVCELDKTMHNVNIEILIPRNVENLPKYKNIKVVRWGWFTGICWEQISYPLYLLLKHRVGINFCSTPLLKADYAYLHDVTMQVNPQYCSKLYSVYSNILAKNVINRAQKLFTVSEFSKDEIRKFYHVPEKKIEVIGNAWQHMIRLTPDTGIFSKHPEIKMGEYIFSLSSLSPNKNHQWIIKNALTNPNQQYIIAGGINNAVFGSNNPLTESDSNIIYLGYVTDEVAKALMMNAKAFLFPTFYEGFGIPPLEALSCGTKIIVSSTPCMKEIYGDAAYYIDPHNPNINIQELLQNSVSDPEIILEKYSWQKSAERLSALLEADDMRLHE